MVRLSMPVIARTVSIVYQRRSKIYAPRYRVKVCAGLSKVGLEKCQLLVSQIETGENSKCLHALVAGPMPWILPTGNASTKPGPISGVITY